MIRTSLLATAAVVALSASPALSASFATGYAFSSLFLVDWEGDINALTVETFEPIVESDVETGGDAFADSDPFAEIDGAFGQVDVFTRADAFSDGFAVADAFAGVDWFLTNNSEDPITLFFDFEYITESEVGVDAVPADFADQFTEISLTLNEFGDLFFLETFLRDGEGGFAEEDAFEISFTIAGGDSEGLTLEAISNSYADTITPIPLPAAGWMLGGGLAALAGLRASRRRKATV